MRASGKARRAGVKWGRTTAGTFSRIDHRHTRSYAAGMWRFLFTFDRDLARRMATGFIDILAVNSTAF
jgi:hypothetical protein